MTYHIIKQIKFNKKEKIAIESLFYLYGSITIAIDAVTIFCTILYCLSIFEDVQSNESCYLELSCA